MIAFRISLLENFGTCSVIASYYGPTHQSFLLLSQLSKESRKMLDDNYEGILNSLIGTAIWLNVYEDEQKDLLSLPWDLFRYDISLCSQITVDLFIQLIERIRNKEGYFFNEHFMHNRLCIERLDLDSELYENFELLLEFLKTTEILYFIAKGIQK